MNTILRWTTILLAGAAAAGATGLAAALSRPDDRLLQGIGFAVTTLPVFLALAYVVLDPAPDRVERPEDSVESAWIERATSAAFLDLMTVLGLSVAVQYVLDVEPLPLVALLVVAMVDSVVRYLLIRRREG